MTVHHYCNQSHSQRIQIVYGFLRVLKSDSEEEKELSEGTGNRQKAGQTGRSVMLFACQLGQR